MPLPYLTVASWVDVLLSIVGTLTTEVGALTDRQVLELVLQNQYDIAAVLHVHDELYRSLDEWVGQIHGAVQPAADTITIEGVSVPVSSAADLMAIKGQTVGVASALQLAHDYAEANGTAIADVQAICDSIWARVAPGEDPPQIATGADTARILAALYYVAQSVIVPAWSIDNTEVLAAIEDAKNQGMSDTTAIATNDNANHAEEITKLDALLGYGDAVNLDTDAIIATLAEGLPGGPSGPGGYPGLDGVTVIGTHSVSGPTTISGPLDGLLVTVSSVPNGQSSTSTPNGTRYKGLGWVVFMTAEGEGEQLQKLETAKCVLVPKSMSQPASAEVYCKPGTVMTVKAFTINA